MRRSLITLFLSAIAVGTYFSPLVQGALQYDRAAVAAGEIWRVATCHWTHWSLEHLAWDVAMFVILGVLCERTSRRALLACVGLAAPTVAMAVAAFCPQVTHYRGLSGLDAALFSYFALILARRQLREGNLRALVHVGLCLLALLLKIAYEMTTGSAVFVHDATGIAPLPLAHAAGALAGLIAGSGHLRGELPGEAAAEPTL